MPTKRLVFLMKTKNHIKISRFGLCYVSLQKDCSTFEEVRFFKGDEDFVFFFAVDGGPQSFGKFSRVQFELLNEKKKRFCLKK